MYIQQQLITTLLSFYRKFAGLQNNLQNLLALLKNSSISGDKCNVEQTHPQNSVNNMFCFDVYYRFYDTGGVKSGRVIVKKANFAQQ